MNKNITRSKESAAAIAGALRDVSNLKIGVVTGWSRRMGESLYRSDLIGLVKVTEEALDEADETGRLILHTIDFDTPDSDRITAVLRGALRHRGVAHRCIGEGDVLIWDLNPLTVMILRADLMDIAEPDRGRQVA